MDLGNKDYYLQAMIEGNHGAYMKMRRLGREAMKNKIIYVLASDYPKDIKESIVTELNWKINKA